MAESDDKDRSIALATIAASVGLDILRTAEALTHVLIAFERRGGGTHAERLALDEIRALVAELIERLQPIADADDAETARALAEWLDPETTLEDVTGKRKPN